MPITRSSLFRSLPGALLVAILLSDSLDGQTWTPEHLAVAHQSTVDSIHTADIRAILSQDYGNRFSNQRLRWCRRGPRERHTWEYTFTADDTVSHGMVDVCVDYVTEEVRQLQAADRNDLSHLRPLQQLSVGGSISKLYSTDGIISARLSSNLFIRFCFDQNDAPLTLSQIVRDYEDVRVFPGESEVDGDPCVHLQCAHPTGRGTWDLYFSRRHAMWVRKAVQTRPDHTTTRVLSDFITCSNGVYLPTRIEVTTCDLQGRQIGRVSLKLTQTLINGDLEVSATQLVFPEHLLVVIQDGPAGTLPHSLALIGDGGNISRSFPVDEFDRFREEVLANPTSYGYDAGEQVVATAIARIPNPRTTYWPYVLAAITFLFGAALLFIRVWLRA